MPATVIAVALPVPMRRCFDYLPADPPAGPAPQAGVRVSVPFKGRGTSIGVVIEVRDTSTQPAQKLKRISAVLDEEPLFDERLLQLLRWASDYYAHPLGEVIQHAVPQALRQGSAALPAAARVWHAVAQSPAPGGRLGPRQSALLAQLRNHPAGLPEETLLAGHAQAKSTLASLMRRGQVRCSLEPRLPPIPNPARAGGFSLTAQQSAAVEQINAGQGRFGVCLVNGVTGSGKTEVYLDLVGQAVAARRQALLLVPEIGLTPQLIERVRDRVKAHIVVMHSGLPEPERLKAWQSARDGSADIVIGTRSAVWTPLRRPGLIVVDEEHDISYKQREGFRYSARDVAIKRARDANVPVILGSATPSLESLHNVRLRRYAEVRLSVRAKSAPGPEVRVIDLRGRRMQGAFSDTLLAAMQREIAAQRQVLVFLNRRGYSPVLMCHACGWLESCARCNVPLTFHKRQDLLLCHHCGSRRRIDDECQSCKTAPLLRVGYGTERLEETLQQHFPKARILRVDRDSTRARGAFGRMFKAINEGEADVLVGTQMLAKGHDFPNLTLVGIIDADRGLFSNDFRAGERLAQLFVQVSGRTGRSRLPGTVMIQTHYPQHPLIQSLQTHAYQEMAGIILEERRAAQLPPYSFWAVLRAEDYRAERPMQFLSEARRLLEPDARGIEVSGPHPAPVERRADRLRYQLILQAGSRADLNRAVTPWVRALENLKSARKVRWSLDIDPLEVL